MSPPKSNEKSINWEEALETVGGDQELLIIVFDAAVKEFPIMLDALSTAFEEKDQPTARRIAHTIKGAALATAAETTQTIAAQIELDAENNDLDSAQRQVPKLKLAIDEMLLEYQRFQNKT